MPLWLCSCWALHISYIFSSRQWGIANDLSLHHQLASSIQFCFHRLYSLTIVLLFTNFDFDNLQHLANIVWSHFHWKEVLRLILSYLKLYENTNINKNSNRKSNTNANTSSQRNSNMVKMVGFRYHIEIIMQESWTNKYVQTQIKKRVPSENLAADWRTGHDIVIS